MVGLSVVLEGQKFINKVTQHQVINKVTMMIKPSSPTTLPSLSTSSRSNFPATGVQATGFLDHCFLCKQKLLPGNDIYMYKGDKAFCSVECRCRQIFMDEEESFKRDNCSLAAMKPQQPISSSSSSSSSRNHKGARNRGNRVAY